MIIYPPRSLRNRPWKPWWLEDLCLSYGVSVTLQGRTVKLRGGGDKLVEYNQNKAMTLPETNKSPLKMMVSNRNFLFQGSICGYVSFREGISWLIIIKTKPARLRSPGPKKQTFRCGAFGEKKTPNSTGPKMDSLLVFLRKYVSNEKKHLLPSMKSWLFHWDPYITGGSIIP